MKKRIWRIRKKLDVLIHSSYRCLKLSSFINYCTKENDSEISIVQDKRLGRVYPIFFWGEKQKPEPLTIPLPSTYYSKLKQAKIIGQSGIVITEDGYILHDVLSDKEKSNINVTDHGLLLLLNRVVHIKNRYIATYSSRGSNIESGILFCGNFSDNYYHFIVEFLVKFNLINAAGIDKSIPLLVDDAFYSVSQMRTLFDIFNSTGRKIISIKGRELHEVENLYVFSSVNEIAPNRKNVLLGSNSDFCIDITSIDYLRRVIYNHYHCKWAHNPDLKIYLSRSKTKRRHCNEEDFVPELISRDFTIIYPEQLTFYEQLMYFSSAGFIIAPTGAALTNLIFVNPECKILVLQKTRKDIPIFTNLVGNQGNDIRYLVSEDDANNQLHSDFSVSLVELNNILNFWGVN